MPKWVAKGTESEPVPEPHGKTKGKAKTKGDGKGKGKKGEKPAEPAEEKSPEPEEEEEITSPILLAPSVGPVYDKMHMLRFFNLAKDQAEGEAIGKKVSLTSRPAPLDEAVIDEPTPSKGSKAEKRVQKTKSGGVEEPTTPVISLSNELPGGPGSYGQLPPELAWYFNSMFSTTPMGSTYGYTTVMLRNIPNRYSRDMLVDRLNQSYKNEFDFVYLPIDFNSKCNVGYAFINFRTPIATQNFLNEFNGTKTKTVLPGFSSNKICEVSFARVQGRDNNMENLRDEKFIEKLTESPEWQPLFWDDNMVDIPFTKALGTGRSRARTRAESGNLPPTTPAGAMPPMMPPMTPAGGYPHMGSPMSGYGSPMGAYPGMFPGAMGFDMPQLVTGLAAALPNASGQTMVMLRGTPLTTSRDKLIETLNKEYKHAFDFVFLPGDDAGKGSRGFAFINFKGKKKMEVFTASLTGKKPSEVFGVEPPAEGEEKPLEVVGARLHNVDKIIERLKASAAKAQPGEESSEWYPVLIGGGGKVQPYPLDATGPAVAAPATPKAKAKAKGKSEPGEGEEKGKARGKGKKGAPPPPPSQPPPYGYPGYPGYSPYGYPGMPPVHPAYAAAMQQAAQAHAKAAGSMLESLSAAVNPGKAKPLDDEGKANLRIQIEFYFSVDNLCKDIFLRSYMNPQGWTPIELISQFPKVKKYKVNAAIIEDALKNSDVLEVNLESHHLRLKDEALRTKWAQVPNEYRQTITSPKKGKEASAKELEAEKAPAS